MRSFTVSTNIVFVLKSTDSVIMYCRDWEDKCILTGDIAAGCKLLRNRYESKDREWASYTCVLGFHVMGEKQKMFVPSCVVIVVATKQVGVTLMTVAVVFQVCGWRALTAQTSTPCVALTVRGWWLWLMTSVKSTCSSTPVLNQRYCLYGLNSLYSQPTCLMWLSLHVKQRFLNCLLDIKRTSLCNTCERD